MSDRSEYFRAYNATHRAERRAHAKAHPEYQRRYQERHAEAIRLRARVRRAMDPASARAADKAWRDANPDKMFARTLRAFYNMTREQYDALLEVQDGVCAICRQPERFINRRTGLPHRLAVDHDHRCCPGSKSCGQCVAGLLCHACNAGGGKFGDDPDLLRAAADYFERRDRATLRSPSTR